MPPKRRSKPPVARELARRRHVCTGTPGRSNFIGKRASGSPRARATFGAARRTPSPKVLKLHGSIDWFNRPEEKGRHPATVVRSGRLDWALHEFLVGGANKLLDYNFSIDLHLFHEFQSRLQHANRIVVAGYGFGDPGINVRLLDWVEGNQANRLLVIHPNPEKLRATVEAEWPQLQHAKSLFGATNQTSFVPCRFEQATEPEFLKPIREHLADGDPAGH